MWNKNTMKHNHMMHTQHFSWNLRSKTYRWFFEIWSFSILSHSRDLQGMVCLKLHISRVEREFPRVGHEVCWFEWPRPTWGLWLRGICIEPVLLAVVLCFWLVFFSLLDGANEDFIIWFGARWILSLVNLPWSHCWSCCFITCWTTTIHKNPKN